MEQIGFDDLLNEAAQDNAARRFEQETAHFPSDWQVTLACHKGQIKRYHAAMCACDFETALELRQDAHLLARKLNSNAPGILADDDAPGCRLARTCAAPAGTVPLWGQDGRFQIKVEGIQMAVEMRGMFGLCAQSMTYQGFDVRPVDTSAPFLSETGYRSFWGGYVEPEQGITPDAYVRRLVSHFIAEELKGKLVKVDPDWIKNSLI